MKINLCGALCKLGPSQNTLLSYYYLQREEKFFVYLAYTFLRIILKICKQKNYPVKGQ